LEGDTARSYWEVSTRLEVRPTLGPDGAPIRNLYREVMSIAYGFFSPLEGFMTWNEVESVLRERRLLSGWLFPFPIVFDVSEEELKTSGAKPGDELLLTLKGRPFAVLKVEEVYKLPDRRELADAVFGTPERNGEVVKKRFDEKHPGWLIYRSLKPLAVAGKVTVVNLPRFREPYNRFWTPPDASRKLIEAKGWKVVVAHQTRNVPHIGHEMLMKRAMFVAGGDRPGDAVLVNAIIGAKRPGDYIDEAILEGHEALALGGYFAGGARGVHRWHYLRGADPLQEESGPEEARSPPRPPHRVGHGGVGATLQPGLLPLPRRRPPRPARARHRRLGRLQVDLPRREALRLGHHSLRPGGRRRLGRRCGCAHPIPQEDGDKDTASLEAAVGGGKDVMTQPSTAEGREETCEAARDKEAAPEEASQGRRMS